MKHKIVSIALDSRGRPGDVFRALYGERPFEAPTTSPARFSSQVTPDNPGAPRAPQARPGGPVMVLPRARPQVFVTPRASPRRLGRPAVR